MAFPVKLGSIESSLGIPKNNGGLSSSKTFPYGKGFSFSKINSHQE